MKYGQHLDVILNLGLLALLYLCLFKLGIGTELSAILACGALVIGNYLHMRLIHNIDYNASLDLKELVSEDLHNRKLFIAPNFPELEEEIINLISQCLRKPETEIFYTLYDDDNNSSNSSYPTVECLYVASTGDALPADSFEKLHGEVGKPNKNERQALRSKCLPGKQLFIIMWD